MPAEGAFMEGAAVSVEESDAAPELTEKETLLEVWTVRVPDGAATVRFLLPGDVDADDLTLLIQSADGYME